MSFEHPSHLTELHQNEVALRDSICSKNDEELANLTDNMNLNVSNNCDSYRLSTPSPVMTPSTFSPTSFNSWQVTPCATQGLRQAFSFCPIDTSNYAESFHHAFNNSFSEAYQQLYSTLYPQLYEQVNQSVFQNAYHQAYAQAYADILEQQRNTLATSVQEQPAPIGGFHVDTSSMQEEPGDRHIIIRELKDEDNSDKKKFKIISNMTKKEMGKFVKYIAKSI